MTKVSEMVEYSPRVGGHSVVALVAAHHHDRPVAHEDHHLLKRLVVHLNIAKMIKQEENANHWVRDGCVLNRLGHHEVQPLLTMSEWLM